MNQKILGQRIQIAKKWPLRIINFAPYSYQKSFLIKHACEKPAPLFDVGKTLTDSHKILLVAPSSFQELLIAFPILQCIWQNLPNKELFVLTPLEHMPFLQAVLDAEKVITYDPNDLFWDEKNYQDLRTLLKGHHFDIILNLQNDTPPLISVALRSANPKLSLAISSGKMVSFANLTVTAQEPYNLLRHYSLILDVWRFSNHPLTLQWQPLNSDTLNLNEAQNRIRQIGLVPKQFSIFLWQIGDEDRQKRAFALARKEMQTAGVRPLFLYSGSTSPEALTEFHSLPQLGGSSIGKMLALFAQAVKVYGCQGDLWHLANLIDVPLHGYFREAEAPFDTAFFNPRCTVEYLDIPEA